ncbi:MAG: S1 family peptidase [Acidobacteria bacterium]|nr:S1 family peptidase [Acidobacteriota bacterium]MCA1643818.1 S1 family peptidase [Acidobacteriota bacterium]
MRRKVLALAAAILLTAVTALAITYGQPDGNRHPEVGALVGKFSSGTYPYCSGTLVSPTIFVTAAHCDLGTQTVYVTFDTKFSSKSKLYRGTYQPDPQYNQAQDNPHDLAVVVFDRAINGITPASLPAAGQLDNLPADQKFTAVGYGGQEPVNQPGGPVIGYLDTREFAVSTLNAVNPAWLRLSQNAATGNGGTCYGDSGGPNFLGAGARETNIVAATTITGDTFCKSTNVVYRLDTPSARAFLGGFVNLP